MNSDYEFSITKVNNIINELSIEEKDKIPQNVINFFSNNSNNQLLENNCDLYNRNLNFNEMDKKFLKIIDYYLNGF